VKKFCGIYAIISEKYNVVYIGSSVDIKKRYSWHLATFRKGKHYSRKLQEIFNKDKDSIKLSILEECDFDDLTTLEDDYIKHFNMVGWNVENKNRTFTRNRMNEEIRKKLSELNKGERNPNARLKEKDIITIRQYIDDGMPTFSSMNECHSYS